MVKRSLSGTKPIDEEKFKANLFLTHLIDRSHIKKYVQRTITGSMAGHDHPEFTPITVDILLFFLGHCSVSYERRKDKAEQRHKNELLQVDAESMSPEQKKSLMEKVKKIRGADYVDFSYQILFRGMTDSIYQIPSVNTPAFYKRGMKPIFTLACANICSML